MEEDEEEDDEDDEDAEWAAIHSRTCRWGTGQGQGPKFRGGQNNNFKYHDAQAQVEREGEGEGEGEERELRDPLESDSSIIVISANYNIRNKYGRKSHHKKFTVNTV